MAVTPNDIDLTTVAAIKKWIDFSGISTDAQDQIIQDTITAFSSFVLHMTGRGPADGSIPEASPFVEPVEYDEFYDGNGNDTLPLNNWPITAVASVNDSGITIPAAAGINSPGYVVDQTKKFLVLRAPVSAGGGAYSFRSPRYCRAGWTLGAQNIQVQYTAGFAAIPFDLEMMARKVVSLNYKRRGWIGQSSQQMAAGAGSIMFGQWEMGKDDAKVIEFYKSRVA